MQNRKINIFLILTLCVTLVLGLVGCQNVNRALEESVSEIHETVLNGSDDDFFVEAIGGKMEAEYALDGVKNPSREFVSIRVRETGDENVDTLSAVFTLENNDYDLSLKRSPVDSSVWTVYIESSLPVETLDLTLVYGEDSRNFQLKKVVAGEVKPLDILKTNFENELMQCYENGKFNCEISVRLVRSPKKQDEKYFWHVVVYKPDKTFFGLMIDASTGEVLSKKS